MPRQSQRIYAFWGLMGIAGLLAAFRMFPLSIPFLERHPTVFKQVRAWMAGARFVTDQNVVLQPHGNDCGPASLKMIFAAHGIECSLSDLASVLRLTPRGTSMLDLRLVSTRMGVPARSWAIQPRDLFHAPLPAIAVVRNDHFVVIRRFITPEILEVDDPALGRLRFTTHAFHKIWSGETLIFDPSWTPL